MAKPECESLRSSDFDALTEWTVKRFMPIVIDALFYPTTDLFRGRLKEVGRKNNYLKELNGD